MVSREKKKERFCVDVGAYRFLFRQAQWFGNLLFLFLTLSLTLTLSVAVGRVRIGTVGIAIVRTGTAAYVGLFILFVWL